ncbi:MAG: FAD binding domain-containing protein [Spirochaetaceae bacterium]|jgi:CO/xanthine dehydrogenase FAD-binding subunit|nr:FAD binding domain-containing protein [Spirochaetaceae bacterium]
MAESTSQIYTPLNLQELFAQWGRQPDSRLYSCGTKIVKFQRGRRFVLPQKIISLEKIEELKRISRTERYLELGSMVKLNKILSLGRIVPELLRKFLELCETEAVRNLETLCGAIFAGASGHDLTGSTLSTPPESGFRAVRGAMCALGASYELRTASTSRWISASRYSNDLKNEFQNPDEILVRVRIPLEKWDWILCRKFRAFDRQGREEGYAAFLARVQNDTLSEVRIVFSGEDLLRDSYCEHMITGKKLPLSKEETKQFLERWKTFFNGVPGSPQFLTSRCLRFLYEAAVNFTE